ncbi:hypothetical protein Nepgr_033503 [Nepenthes gracilis]|uniref:Uncharacterized protein n=1 Tax=Nepenthes gracilis TaxID=150966 RepID=A0AAD3TM04_NEPGR|nr:hypothetical protein Nepgr_033503 [Nepenthes gracilis]
MPIVASLWTQKVKRWSDFLIFSASCTVFLHNNDVVVQLLKSCFVVALGLSASPISSGGSVGALLGHGFGSDFYGGISPVTPGILYLRVYRSIRDIMFLAEQIVSLLMQTVREIACAKFSTERRGKIRKAKTGMRYGQVSLAAAMTRVKIAASLEATLLWSEHEEEYGGMASVLRGYALAYFVVLGGVFAWGIDSSSSASKQRLRILGHHMKFLASELDGKISLGCDSVVW